MHRPKAEQWVPASGSRRLEGGRRRALRQAVSALAVAALACALGGCDAGRIAQLEEGVATEGDVRARFGEPAAIHAEANGGRTLEYPRQPEGRSNLMITIGSDGRMSALRQVLTEANFARVTPGMGQEEVRRLLGQPARTQRYLLAKEEVWDWRFRTGAENKLFSVTFGFDGVVRRSGITLDPRDLYVG